MSDSYDLLVVGGGINGCGIARDAAGRGYSVVLVEQGDLAEGASSRSTKLIHGGLRYLETYQFRLVREALAEREILWRNAPHLVSPLRFVLPVQPGRRPAWLLRLGLFLYDHFSARRFLPPTTSLDLRAAPEGAPLRDELSRGFAYSDCRVDDARLVVLNARDAADRGATILTRTRLVRAEPEGGAWRATLRDLATSAEKSVSARLIVNAAGPWAASVFGLCGGGAAPHLRLVRGSHIVVPRIFEHDGAYIFQNDDGRIVFAIAYERDFTLIGTTDEEFSGPPENVAITPEEIAYLCRAVSGCFTRPVAPSDVVWAFSGLRPLFDSGAGSAAKASRDYVIADGVVEGAPLINVFGGKLTAYRRLSQQVSARIGAKIGARGGAWTENASLPGGDFSGGDREAFAHQLRTEKPFLSADQAARFARSYGTLCRAFLESADLGRDFGAGLTEAEVDYLVSREWARTAEDILWRRSKLGLRFSAEQAAALAAYLAEK